MINNKQIKPILVEDLLQRYIELYFPVSIIVVVEPGSWAFINIPDFIVVKRDNLKLYLQGSQSDFILVEIDNLEDAEDFCQLVERKSHTKASMYVHGEKKLGRDETMSEYYARRNEQ